MFSSSTTIWDILKTFENNNKINIIQSEKEEEMTINFMEQEVKYYKSISIF